MTKPPATNDAFPEPPDTIYVVGGRVHQKINGYEGQVGLWNSDPGKGGDIFEYVRKSALSRPTDAQKAEALKWLNMRIAHDEKLIGEPLPQAQTIRRALSSQADLVKRLEKLRYEGQYLDPTTYDDYGRNKRFNEGVDACIAAIKGE